MLENNLELIVQYPYGRQYRCRGFRGLHLTTPVYLVFDSLSLSDQDMAQELAEVFCQEILRYAGTQEEAAPACPGSCPTVQCHAMFDDHCRKILVHLAERGQADTTAWPANTAAGRWLDEWRKWDAPKKAKEAKDKAQTEKENRQYIEGPYPPSTWEVIPILRDIDRDFVNVCLPPEWTVINVCFWSHTRIDILWAVLQRVGLAPEESRIFISYVRRETAPIADQLFELLTNDGYDVFLDRCSVPAAVNFQQRLMQDLCDKAMVVLLNSEKVSAEDPDKRSRWVEEEIATIKKYRLGLLELRLPNSKERKDIDFSFTEEIDETTDLVPAGADYPTGAQQISPTALIRVRDRIRKVHATALHRRRYELINNFAAALQTAGKSSYLHPDGTFTVKSSTAAGTDTVVGLTVRPPALGDFCSLHLSGQVSPTRPGWLVSPAPFFLVQRHAHVTWLGGVSHIQHASEAQMATLAAKL